MTAETAWLLWIVALIPFALCTAIVATYITDVIGWLARRLRP